jgi:hypothetical protein
MRVESSSLSLGFVLVRLVWTRYKNYDKPALDLKVQQSVPRSKHTVLRWYKNRSLSAV